MEQGTSRKLPIGIQSFEKLRSADFLYVDKTALVYRLAKEGIPCFLSRPRRFGKSLLLSTFEAYFQGKRELFKGLAIEQLEKEWEQHPVLHLSLNAENYIDTQRLEGILEDQLSGWERIYGYVNNEDKSPSRRFMNVIRRAYEQTGQRVVVLVDEYDKPMLNTFDDPELQDKFRSILTGFYTVLKDADPWLQFVFITGVTKFAQMGVFSNLNQLRDISMHPAYTALCGMTLPEIEATFVPELEKVAELNRQSHNQVIEELTRRYDGYRFAPEQTEGMFNPFSVLGVLDSGAYRNYWFSTGTPTFLVKVLQKTDYDLRDLDGVEVTEAGLTDYRVNNDDPVPMIYQSGYLTIKQFDERFRMFVLGYPNEEVKYGFLNYIAPFYTMVTETPFYIGKFIRELESGDTDAFLTRLRAFFADIPYELNENSERHYQMIFYLVFKLMGQFSEAEVRSTRGRADAVVKAGDYIYVFEFKLFGTAEEALAQIDDRGYLIPYLADGRTLVKVGVEFDAGKRNIGRWLYG